jgi:hypothetical protein
MSAWGDSFRCYVYFDGYSNCPKSWVG